MNLEIKEIDGVPVTGIPNGSRTVSEPLTRWHTAMCVKSVTFSPFRLSPTPHKFTRKLSA